MLAVALALSEKHGGKAAPLDTCGSRNAAQIKNGGHDIDQLGKGVRGGGRSDLPWEADNQRNLHDKIVQQGFTARTILAIQQAVVARVNNDGVVGNAQMIELLNKITDDPIKVRLPQLEIPPPRYRGSSARPSLTVTRSRVTATSSPTCRSASTCAPAPCASSCRRQIRHRDDLRPHAPATVRPSMRRVGALVP